MVSLNQIFPSMVGSLYPKQEKTKLDTVFTIFYMGINLELS
jgi:POT family proton-dependent oligopeptide transporter